VAEKLLTDTKIKKARPRDRQYYLSDGGGLRLRIKPSGSRSWLLRYQNAKKENTVSLGTYPVFSLSDAREKAAEYKKLLRSGVNPVLHKSRQKKQSLKAQSSTFGMISREWLDINKEIWSDSHLERNTGLLRRVLWKPFERTPITQISEDDLLSVLREYYDSGAKESARRAQLVAAQVFSFAKETKRVSANPARELKGSPFLKKPPVRHFSALKQQQVGELMTFLRENGPEQRLSINTQCGLLLALYTGLRDNSLRGAKWSEIDFEGKKWTVPETRMKRRRAHTIPLPRQACEVLRKLYALNYSGEDTYVFPSNNKSGHMAENTLRLGLHRLGFKVTVHGMRSLITDVLNENEFPPDAIERQLDHLVGNQVKSAYLRTDFFKKRIDMMQWFADWCDKQIES